MFCANTYHINSIDKMYQPLLLTLDEQTILKNLNLLLAHWVTHTYISGPVGLPTSYCSLRLLVYFCDPWSQPNNIYKNQNTLKWLTDIKEYVNPPTSKANYLRKTNFCHTNDTMITTNSINDINENVISNPNTINTTSITTTTTTTTTTATTTATTTTATTAAAALTYKTLKNTPKHLNNP